MKLIRASVLIFLIVASCLSWSSTLAQTQRNIFQKPDLSKIKTLPAPSSTSADLQAQELLKALQNTSTITYPAPGQVSKIKQVQSLGANQSGGQSSLFSQLLPYLLGLIILLILVIIIVLGRVLRKENSIAPVDQTSLDKAQAAKIFLADARVINLKDHLNQKKKANKKLS